jgi:D-alanyl-D-alanine carboxypeptidase (penicillin-binding protein 5/6)
MIRLICIAFCLALSGKQLQVEVSAQTAALMNAKTGALLYEKNAFAAFHPASTTKIATLLFILAEKNPNLDSVVKVSAESLKKRPADKNAKFSPHCWYVDGTRMDLKEGELVSLESLFHGLMLVSGNDAANVLAEGVSGSADRFVDQMNQYLKKIGCSATQYRNAHGCSYPDHLSTAYDLCLMTKEGLKIPKFREIVSTASYVKPKSNKQGPMELKQYNRLLRPGAFYYPKAFGIKTGFHNESQNNLVAAAEHEGRTLIAAILGVANSDDRYKDAIRLFEAAFAEVKETRRLFGKENLFSRAIHGAKTGLSAGLDGDLSISYYPSEEPEPRAFVHWETPNLPIRKGQRVGELQIVNEAGDVIAKEELLAKADVKGTFLFVVKEFTRKLFPESIER